MNLHLFFFLFFSGQKHTRSSLQRETLRLRSGGKQTCASHPRETLSLPSEAAQHSGTLRKLPGDQGQSACLSPGTHAGTRLPRVIISQHAGPSCHQSVQSTDLRPLNAAAHIRHDLEVSLLLSVVLGSCHGTSEITAGLGAFKRK